MFKAGIFLPQINYNAEGAGNGAGGAGTGDSGSGGAGDGGAPNLGSGDGGAGNSAGGAGPNGAGDWFAGYSEPAQEIARKNGWPTPEAAVVGYGELSTMLGDRNLEGYVKLPTGDETYDDVFKALGRPDTADEYSPVSFPEQYPYDDDPTADWFKAVAHEAGLSDTQHQNVLNKYFEFSQDLTAKAEADAAAEAAAADATLRQEMGAQYATFIATADKAARVLGLEKDQVEAIESAVGTELGKKMFAAIGSMVASDSGPLTGLTMDATSGHQNTSWAENEIRTLKADKEFMEAIRTNRLDDPRWTDHIERWNNANKIASGASAM